MATISELRLALYAWAQNNGIMADNVPVLGGGDANLIPFPPESVEYFRMRKVVRVVADEQTSTLTLYSRQKIADTKTRKLVEAFRDRYGDQSIRLVVDWSKPFKVDQHLDSWGKPEPLRLLNKRICCGSSVGLGNQRNAGTLTALATRKNEQAIYGLSCNHVTGGCGTARPGTPVVVPGIQDIDDEYRNILVIGDHESAAPMSQGLPSVYNTSENRDMAFFSIRDPDKLSSMQGNGTNAYDTPHLFENHPERRMPVKKWGRSTGFTTGEISLVNKDPEPIPYQVQSYYGPIQSQTFQGTVYLHDVIEVTPDSSKPFSLGGDSGSLVVTNITGRVAKVVGVVIAGDKNKSLVLPLKPSLEKYGLRLLASHNV